jgi:hypothetical protein
MLICSARLRGVSFGPPERIDEVDDSERPGVGKSLKSCANGRFVASALKSTKAVFTCGKTLAVGN